MMRYFGGIECPDASFDKASILLQSVPYDGTSTWGKGADRGFDAFMEAADNMELYDIETDSEVYRKGIHLLPPIMVNDSPEAMVGKVYETTRELINTSKFLTFFGGEHSVSIGIIKAFYEKFPGMTVLQLDAHADLRPTYLGTPYNHACALYDASLHTRLIQVGIRSMDRLEMQYVNRETCYFAEDILAGKDWMKESVDHMTDPVYITLDLDVLDPSIMPSTGTPEPGGLSWETTTTYLRKVFSSRNVVGFDLVELAPIPQMKAPDFLVAKLYYKMISYKFLRQ